MSITCVRYAEKGDAQLLILSVQFRPLTIMNNACVKHAGGHLDEGNAKAIRKRFKAQVLVDSLELREVWLTFWPCRCVLHCGGCALNRSGRVLDTPRGLCTRRGNLLALFLGLPLPVVSTGWWTLPGTLEGRLVDARTIGALLMWMPGRQPLTRSRAAVDEATCSCSLAGLVTVLFTQTLQVWVACDRTTRLAEGAPTAGDALAWLSGKLRQGLRLWMVRRRIEARIDGLRQGLLRREGG